jgi:hypothetical protein
MIGYWVETWYWNTIFLGPLTLLVWSWWRWHSVSQPATVARYRKLTTLLSLVMLSLGTVIYLFVPMIFPCNIDGCSGPEEVYTTGMALGLLCALVSTIISALTIRGMRFLIAICALLQLGIWLLIAAIWGS